ncbi:hypothetical protein Bca4012_068718 [Brassica carinata]
MNLYADDLSLLDYNYNVSGPFGEPFSHRFLSPGPLYHGEDDDYRRNISYSLDGAHGGESDDKDSRVLSTQHRHDGKSPLPLGMDWSAPPRQWEGRNTVWPHDPRTGWSYCVTVPSWVDLPKSTVSDPAVFYRVQVAIQSPEGITSTRLILRRFNDFLELHSSIKKEFVKKRLPQAPPKKRLRMKNETLLEERRCSLEDWMNRLLSDLDISRSALIATFLELEAAVSSVDSRLLVPEVSSDAPGSSSVTIDHVNDSAAETSDTSTMKQGEASLKNIVSRGSTSEDNVTDWHELITESGLLDKSKFQETIERLSITDRAAETGTITGEASISREPNQNSMDSHDDVNTETGKDVAIVFQSEERSKLKRVVDTLEQRLETAKADTEDLISRLNQELAVRQFLSTKVKDLEVELETTRESCKQGMEQTVLKEKERFTQIQWDMEELRKQCMEMESLLNSMKDEKAYIETTNQSLVQENEMLLKQNDDLRDKFENLRKEHEELEVKSKAELKVLVKEVKSLRTTQSELRLELSRTIKEKLEMERIVQREKDREETAKTANKKLMHEYDVLQNRLQECNVKFQIEDECELIMESSSPSEAIDLLATSDNRIGLLIAETQLLSEEVETTSEEHGGTGDVVRKMLTEVLIDNARLRKQVNSVLRCSLSGHGISVREARSEQEEEEDLEGSVDLASTVLSKILEK